MLNDGGEYGRRNQQRRRMSGCTNQAISRRHPRSVFRRYLLVDPQPAEFTRIQRLSQGSRQQDKHTGHDTGKPGSAARERWRVTIHQRGSHG